MSRFVWVRFCLSFFLTVLFTVSVDAAPVTRIISHGPSSNRVDVVILGDGYTSSQMSKFSVDAASFAEHLLQEEPFKSWGASFNFVRIDTPSNQSGAGRGAPLDTVYGAQYNCYDIQRLLCVDESKVAEVLSANLPPEARDIVFIIVNDPEYGGSGGQYAVASTDAQSSEIAVHEIGHSFGNLADEYVDEDSCGDYTEPSGINVSNSLNRNEIPWSAWIRPRTPLPTADGSPAIGAFTGAFYCSSGWYRPTYDSKMRTLGVSFREVNSEALILRIYEIVNLYDRVSPASGNVSIKPGSPVKFEVYTANTGNAALSVTWRLDGKTVGSAASVTIRNAMLKGATRNLEAIIRLRTPKVKTDSGNNLIDTVTWTLSPT